MVIVIGIILLLLLLVFLNGFKVVQQYQEGLVFTFGKFVGIKKPGLIWIIPIVQKLTRVDLRVITDDVSRQEIITKDNVSIHVDAVLWYQISNAEWSVIKVKNCDLAVSQLAMTTLRDVLGTHTLDSILKEREIISHTLQNIIDKATDAWGIKVSMVEIKNVEIPDSMKRTMAQEAEAEREKRARIIKADAEYEAAKRLKEAAEEMSKNPMSLELRRMQMISEVGAEQNTTTIVLMPSQFVAMADAITKNLNK